MRLPIVHVQFVGRESSAFSRVRSLPYQNKWSLETRSWSEARPRVKALQKRLKKFTKGEVAPKSGTVATTLQE